MNRFAVCLIGTVTLSLTACGGDDGQDDEHDANGQVDTEELTENDHACDHMEFGPEQAVLAAIEADELPTISSPHTRYDVTMPMQSASIIFDLQEATLAHFFFDQPVSLIVSDESGNALTPSHTIATVDECSEMVDSGVAYDLSAATYTLTLSDAPSELSMIFVPQVKSEPHTHTE